MTGHEVLQVLAVLFGGGVVGVLGLAGLEALAVGYTRRVLRAHGRGSR